MSFISTGHFGSACIKAVQFKCGEFKDVKWRVLPAITFGGFEQAQLRLNMPFALRDVINGIALRIFVSPRICLTFPKALPARRQPFVAAST